MTDFLIDARNDNFDPEGLVSFCNKVTDTDTTMSSSIPSNYKGAASKLIIASTVALSCFSEGYAFDNVVFNQSNNFENSMSNYSELVDKPMVEYFAELNKHVFSSKSQKSDLIRKIVAFESLKTNWDGYGAYPLEVLSAANAINFINLLDDNSINSINDILPSPNGTISIFWQNTSNERISLEVGNNNYSYYVKYNSQKPIFKNGITLDYKEAKIISDFVKSL